jgi:hypothetical protein
MASAALPPYNVGRIKEHLYNYVYYHIACAPRLMADCTDTTAYCVNAFFILVGLLPHSLVEEWFFYIIWKFGLLFSLLVYPFEFVARAIILYQNDQPVASLWRAA